MKLHKAGEHLRSKTLEIERVRFLSVLQNGLVPLNHFQRRDNLLSQQVIKPLQQLGGQLGCLRVNHGPSVSRKIKLIQ